ncbi:MAG: tetratricopeptide (TPR) repeat protein, partial [Candidatus Paceibacteria bacterium]
DMDARSDVYSMGAILYELLAGVPPHIHPGESPVLVDSMTLLKRAIHERPTALQTFTSSAPPELISICEKAMSPDREQRYPDVMALSEDLAAFMEDRVVKVHQTGALVELRKWVQRNRGMAATLVGSVVMLLGAAGITIYLVQEEEKRTRVALHAEEAAVVEMKAAVAETKAALVIRDGALATSKTSLAAEVVAKEEAQESADLARNRLAREWLSTGRTQGALGRWDDALKYYDDAAEKDDLGELEIELQLARSEALQAQYRRQEALEILDELESRDDLGALQSLVDLRLGALSLVGWREIDAEEDNGEALVRSALASKALTPADTAFAEALLAKETWTTRDRLLEALRIEPFHYFANSLLLPYYMLSGRRSEAVGLAKKMQQLFPSDPTPRVTLAMCYATQQNFDGAWEQFALLESTLPEEGMEQLKKSIELCEKYKFESHLGTYFGCEHRFLSGKAVNQIQTHSISNIFQGKHFRELIPQVPSMRDAMDLGLEALTDIMWGRYEKGSALLKQALKIHDDGVFRYSIATVHLLSAPATDPPRLRQILLEVIEGCKLAESTPSMLPTISAPARFMRLRCEAIVARVNFKESGSEQVYDEVLAHVKLMDTFEGAGDCSFGFMRGELLSTKAPAAIPYELSSAWLRRVPDSELAARAFIDDAQRHGLPAEALARLDNLRVMVGDEEALMLLRSELITEISLATPGATPGESPQLPDETDLAPTPSTPKDQ